MNCREFEEIADSYLSAELLVETNHEVLHHLENCAGCRSDLAERREIRERLRAAVKRSAIMDPALAVKVRDRTFGRASKRGSRALVPALGLAGIVVLILAGLAVYLRPFSPPDSAVADTLEWLRTNGLTAALHDALGNHKHCGLKFGALPAQEIVNDEEYEVLKARFSGDLEFVVKHDCIFNGRKYTHTVLRSGGKLISILKTASDSEGGPNKIISLPVENLQVAEFVSDNRSVFVISDLSESENLQIARLISNT